MARFAANISFLFTELCAALDRLGYDGWVGAEYRPRGRTEDGLGWLSRFTASG